MKRFITLCFIFIVLSLACDYIVGKAISAMADKAISGQALKNREIANSITPDILILGSSRSTHHYVPSVIEDSTGLKVYISGQDGNGIVMMWPQMRYIADRHHPQLIIYDVTPVFDIADDDNHKYLRYVRPLWGKNIAVDSIIRQIDNIEPLKLLSYSYRYNGSLPSIIKGTRPGEIYKKGFSPLYGEFKSGNDANTSNSNLQRVNDLKLRFFNDMMNYAKTRGIRMVFIYSPTYRPATDEPLTELQSLIAEHGFEFYDYRSDSLFVGNETLFKDPDHLNIDGAELFTKQIIQHLRI